MDKNKNKFDKFSFDELSELIEAKKEEIEELQIKIDLKTNKQGRLRKVKLEEELKELFYALDKLNMDRQNKKKEENKRMKNEEMIFEKRTMEYSIGDIIRGTENRDLTMTSDGTAIIPENVEESINKKMENISPIFEQARKLTSDVGQLKVARESDTIEVGFVGEGENVAEEALKFDFVKLDQKRVGGAITLSNQLINDSSVDIEDYTADLLARRTARAIEKSILTGAGDKEFQGIIHDPYVNSVDVTGTVTVDDLLELYLGVHQEFLSGSSFIMSREFFNQIAKLKDQNGHFYMQNGIVNGKVTHSLFEMPVYVTDALPETTPVIFGNISESVTMLIKRGSELKRIASDTKQALRGSVLFVYDFYADSSVTNPQGLVKLNVTP